MTFLNWAMLFGLVAVSIPIIIHLLNRRKAEMVDWGAMRFLLDSLAARNRRIRLEELLLMILRCLAIALLVLALARPFLPVRSKIPLLVVLPALLLAVVCVASAGVLWKSNPRGRWLLLAATAVLVGGAILASVSENILQSRLWPQSGADKDVALVIDGSMSMSLEVDGQKNFQRAVKEAHVVADICRPGDGLSVILAGSVPQTLISKPTADRAEVAGVLERLQPTKGSMRVLEALNAAAAALAEGKNPAKKIVLITDGQNVGWDLKNEARWKFLAAGLKGFTTQPQIICRQLALPKHFSNIVVADVTFSRKVVGTDRPVKIDVKVMNTGSAPLKPTAVELSVDGAVPKSEMVGEIKPDAVETIQFEHRFDKPGPHLVSAHVVCDDDLPADNTTERVLNVLDRLPVLVVDGAPAPGTLDGASSFIEIALTPRSEEPEPTPSSKKPAKAPAKAPEKAEPAAEKAKTPESEEDVQFLVEPTVVPATGVGALKDLGAYSLIILANVPKLPDQTADAVARFVRDGGGLLITPGDRALPEFYNRWAGVAGETMVPARLLRRKNLEDEQAHLALNTFSHQALALFTDPKKTDASNALVSAYWALEANMQDPTVRVGALLDSGDPMLVERKVGKGYVILTAMALDRRDTSLRTLKCFVPMMHELVAYLASPQMLDSNVQPGAEMTIEMPVRGSKDKVLTEKDLRAMQDVIAKVGPVEVVTPSDRHLPATLALGAKALRVSFSGTQEPGLYRVALPPEVGRQYGTATDDKKGTPFVVLGEAGESHLAPLADVDLQGLEKLVNLRRIDTTQELQGAVAERIPGEEVWKYLAIALLVAVVGEIGLTRWIAMQRRTHVKQEVRFSDRGPGVRAFQVGAMATASSREPTSVAKS